MRIGIYFLYLIIFSLSSCYKIAEKPALSRVTLIKSPLVRSIDSLLNINQLKPAHKLLIDSKLKSFDCEDFNECSYIWYKINKSIFYHNYFYPCDSLSFIKVDSIAPGYDLLYDYYVSNVFHDEIMFKKVLKQLIATHKNDAIHTAEMLSEIARFYLHEGNQSDSSNVYYNQALNIYETSYTSSLNKVLILRNLVYLQFPERKDHLAEIFAQKINQDLPPHFNFDNGLQLMQKSLIGFCHYRLKRRKEGDLFFDQAFEFSKSNPCTYHQQEVYKLYFSGKLIVDLNFNLHEKLRQLDSLVSRDGNFCNLDKIKGEYLFYSGKADLQSEYHLEQAYHYIQNHRPFNTLQVYTITYLLYECLVRNRKYDRALDLLYTQDQDVVPGKIIAFNRETIFAKERLDKEYSYVTMENFAKTLLKKYKDFKKKDDLDLAKKIIQTADSLVSKEIKSFDESIILNIYKSSKDVYHTAMEIQNELYLLDPKDYYLNEYLYYLEKNRTRMLHRDMRLNQVSKLTRDLEIDHEKKIRQQISLFTRIKNLDSLKYYSDKLDQFYSLAKSEKLWNTALMEKQKFQSIASVKLNSNEVYLDFAKIKDRIYIFILKKDIHNLVSLEATDSLMYHLDQIRQAQGGYKDMNATSYQYSAYYVYTHLLKDHLGNESVLTYSSDALLNGINPEALVASPKKVNDYDQLDYLIRTVTIENVESIYLKQDKNNKYKSDSVLGFFFSDHKTLQKSNVAIKELPGSILEQKELEKLITNHRFYAGEACNKRTFFNEKMSKYDVLHLSLHGFSTAENTQMLYFLFRSTSQLDTIFGDELLGRKYPELVVLSACATGQGKYEEGEGKFTLARYFLQSGSSKVISSLWNLDDTAGSLLMRYFYKELKLSQNPTSALRTAKLNLLAKYKNFSQPYFWAGLG